MTSRLKKNISCVAVFEVQMTVFTSNSLGIRTVTAVAVLAGNIALGQEHEVSAAYINLQGNVYTVMQTTTADSLHRSAISTCL